MSEKQHEYANPWGSSDVYLWHLDHRTPQSVRDFMPSYLVGVGHRDVLFKQFINGNLLRLATIPEMIERKFPAEKLKHQLQARGCTKLSGTKLEMVERLLPYLTDEEIKNFNLEVHYRLTPLGQELAGKAKASVKNKIGGLCTACEKYINEKHYAEAFKVLMSIRNNAPFPIGMGYAEEAVYIRFRQIIQNNYLVDELPVDSSIKLRIKSAIAIHYVLDAQVFQMEDISTSLLNIWPDFECSSLEAFRHAISIGVYETWSYDPTSQKGMCRLLYHAVLFRAINQIDFKNLQRWKNSDRFKGLSIIGVPKCNLCKGESRNYAWTQIESLPELPMYPGCPCLYVIWPH